MTDALAEAVAQHMAERGRLFNPAEARDRCQAEITESIVTGLPALQAMAEEDGPDACEELRAQVEVAMVLLPA